MSNYLLSGFTGPQINSILLKIGHDVTTSTLVNLTELEKEIARKNLNAPSITIFSNKCDIYQGTSLSGMIMAVGVDGKLTTVSPYELMETEEE